MNRKTNNSINNNSILEYIVNYMNVYFKIDNNTIVNNTKKYIKLLLCEFRNNNYELTRIEKNYSKKKEQLQGLMSGYCRSENLTPSIEGKNTGGRLDKSQLRYIQMGQLREEMEEYILNSLLLEKKINEENDNLIKFINLLSNPAHKSVLLMSSQQCMSVSQIARELNYSDNYIWTCKNRAIGILSNLVKDYINSSD